jgi:hypothetical protein
MIVRKPRYSKEELAARGRALFDQRVRSRVEPAQNGRIVAVDVETGEFAVADDVPGACRPLIASNPDAQIWTIRVGRRAVHRIGNWIGPRPSA